MSGPELILHHYDFSPFSEKIRLIFGLKGLSWRSVLIPSVLPKPNLVSLTGGYRHTPVLQIGADVFCDTRLIARELDRRFSAPKLIERGRSGLEQAVESWAERELFWPVARFVSGMNAERLPPQLHADRAAMRGKHTPSIVRLKRHAESSFNLVQTHIARIDDMLHDGRSYLLSDAPGRADFAVYHALWFLSAMPIDCSAVLADSPKILRWMKRIGSIGHGTSREMSETEALDVASAAGPAKIGASRPAAFDPAIGSWVGIRPDEYTCDEIVGELVFTDREEIALLRVGPRVGEVVVHFPRVGYGVRRIDTDRGSDDEPKRSS